MSFQVEKDWTTGAGLRAVVIVVSRVGDMEGNEYKSHRCGYVGVPQESSLAGIHYDNINISCHWGLTFSTNNPERDYPVESNLHWFGFDCYHYEDGTIERSPLDIEFGTSSKDYPIRSLEYCEAQCEGIAAQLVALEITVKEQNGDSLE